jgi:hypothetical protein
MGEKRNAERLWRGNLKKTDSLEDLGVGGSVISKWILTF